MTLTIGRRVDPSRLGSLVITAALVGLLAGIAAATFATIAGEPAVDDAIAIEEANAAANPEPHDAHAGDEASVDRSDQRGIGLFSAYALTGAAFGGLLALATHGFRRRRPEAVGRVYLAGAILAGGFTLAPWLKYPPNPPAVGNPDTLAERQSWYVAIICVAIAVGIGAALLSSWMQRNEWPVHRRIALVVAAVAVPMLVVYAAFPGAPDDIAVPAALVWRFRVASLGANLLLWSLLTLGVGWLVGDSARRGIRDKRAPITTSA